MPLDRPVLRAALCAPGRERRLQAARWLTRMQDLGPVRLPAPAYARPAVIEVPGFARGTPTPPAWHLSAHARPEGTEAPPETTARMVAARGAIAAHVEELRRRHPLLGTAALSLTLTGSTRAQQLGHHTRLRTEAQVHGGSGHSFGGPQHGTPAFRAYLADLARAVQDGVPPGVLRAAFGISGVEAQREDYDSFSLTVTGSQYRLSADEGLPF